MIFKTDKPKVSGVYLVDRTGEKLGTPYRYYDVEKDFWGLCSYDYDTAVEFKDRTVRGFLPYNGPVKARPKPAAPDQETVVELAKPSIVKVSKAKSKQPDGTIFFREDRKKWVVVVAGKQPCARDSKDGVTKWLAKKHPELQPLYS